VTVTVNPVATANAGSSQAVCSGTSLTLAGAVGGAVSGGTWSGGAGTYTPNNATLNAVYTPTAAEYASGSLTLTLTSDDPAGPCTFASSSVTFIFYQNPVVDFSVNDPSGCPVHCGTFTDLSTVVAGDAIVSWNWDFGDGSPDSITQNTSHCYSASGFYNVELTVTSNHGCVSDSTQIQMVEVFDVPIAEFTPTPNPASILDPEVTLNNGSSSDVISWTYYFGDGDSIAPNVSSPVHTYPTTGPATYTATLMVENSDGCRDTVEHLVEIGPEFTFFIPNAFTPNGDGVNDLFYGQGIGIIKYDIWIFDRWGNMIYHGDNIDTSMWDGRANNGKEVAQQDVYVWKVKLTDVFEKKHNYIGTVTLVK
jgi:gliding motility-associated-like protein